MFANALDQGEVDCPHDVCQTETREVAIGHMERVQAFKSRMLTIMIYWQHRTCVACCIDRAFWIDTTS